MDRIYIRDLALRCIVGVYDFERNNKQDIVINLTMQVDLNTPCNTDKLEDTVDYKQIKKQIVAMVESSDFQLIESLAQAVANICLANNLVQEVTVSVDKPGALRFAKSVAVEISRRNVNCTKDNK